MAYTLQHDVWKLPIKFQDPTVFSCRGKCDGNLCNGRKDGRKDGRTDGHPYHYIPPTFQVGNMGQGDLMLVLMLTGTQDPSTDQTSALYDLWWQRYGLNKKALQTNKPNAISPSQLHWARG